MKVSVISIALYKEASQGIQPGSTVELIKDRDRPIGERVIQCRFDGQCVGYVSTSQTVQHERGCLTNVEVFGRLPMNTEAMVVERYVEQFSNGRATVFVVEIA